MHPIANVNDKNNFFIPLVSLRVEDKVILSIFKEDKL